MKRTSFSALLAAAALAGQASAQDIVDILANDPQFSTLVTAVQTAGLESALKGPGPLTVFAPTNDAFNALPPGALNDLLANPDELTQVLLYHVIGDELLAAEVLQGGDATTLQGLDVEFSNPASGPQVNDAPILATDTIASNGVIHTIGSVLDPASAPIDLFDGIRGNPNFTLLTAALELTGLDDALNGDGPFTVFAPTDRAFLSLGNQTLRSLAADPDALTDILLTHVIGAEVLASDVLAGGLARTLSSEILLFNNTPFGAYVNASRVTQVNRFYTNGVLHTIDTVIVPPQPTIVDQLVAFPEFETLVTAVETAGLVDTLSGDTEFTLFAPVDAAFAALPPGVLDGLLQDPQALGDVLTYHVVPGKVFASDVLNANSATTVQGADVTFSVQNGNVFVNGAQITTVDVEVGNGVIHFIDGVLTPPGS
jgi:transforming growth factor-beta-induced protein